MQIYIASTLFSVLSAWIAQNIDKYCLKKYGENSFNLEKSISYLFKLLTIIPISLVSAFRYDVGTDFESYVMMYDHPEWFRQGNRFLNVIMNYLRSNAIDKQYFFVASSLLICALFCITTFCISDNPALSILLFVVMEDYFVSMNIVRQFLAIAIIYIAVIFLVKDKIKISVILILMASLIHSTALIVLILVGLKVFYTRRNLNPKQFFLQIIISSMFTFVSIPLLKMLVVNYTSYGAYFYTSYSDNQYSVATLMLLIYLSISFLIILFCDFSKDLKFQLCCGTLVLNIIILVASYSLTGNTYRLTYYFSGIFALCFPTVLRRIPNKWVRMIASILIVISFTVWTVLLISHNNQNVLPYNYYLPFR